MLWFSLLVFPVTQVPVNYSNYYYPGIQLFSVFFINVFYNVIKVLSLKTNNCLTEPYFH